MFDIEAIARKVGAMPLQSKYELLLCFNAESLAELVSIVRAHERSLLQAEAPLLRLVTPASA